MYCTRSRAHCQPPGSPGRPKRGYFDGGPLACTSHAPQALEKMGCGCGQHQHLSTRTRELRAGCGLVSWMAAAAAAAAAAAVLAASWSGCCSAAAAPVPCGCWLLVRCGRCCCLCLCCLCLCCLCLCCCCLCCCCLCCLCPCCCCPCCCCPCCCCPCCCLSFFLLPLLSPLLPLLSLCLCLQLLLIWCCCWEGRAKTKGQKHSKDKKEGRFVLARLGPKRQEGIRRPSAACGSRIFGMSYATARFE